MERWQPKSWTRWGEKEQKVSLWDMRKSEKCSGVNQDYWVFCFTSMPYLTATRKPQGMATPVKESAVQWVRAWTGLAFQLLPKRKMDQSYGVVIQSLSHVWPLVTPWTAACQASLSITNSLSLLKLSSNVIQPSHPLSSPSPPTFNLPQNQGFFPMSQFFASGGQSTGVSALASFLPKNTQDWSPLGCTGWISLLSKGLSRVFSNTTVQKHQFFSTQLSL